MLINFIVTTKDELLDETYLYLVKSQNARRAFAAVESAASEGEELLTAVHLSELTQENSVYSTDTLIGHLESGNSHDSPKWKNLVFAGVVLNEGKELQELLFITAPAEQAAIVTLAEYQTQNYENEVTYGAVMPLSKLLTEDEVIPLEWHRDPEEELVMLADAAGLTDKARG